MAWLYLSALAALIGAEIDGIRYRNGAIAPAGTKGPDGAAETPRH